MIDINEVHEVSSTVTARSNCLLNASFFLITDVQNCP